MCFLRYDVVLFDVDDTLIDHNHSEKYALTNVFKDHGININSSYIESFRKINHDLWNEYVNDKLKLELKQLRTERFVRLISKYELQIDPNHFSEQYTKHLIEGSLLIDGAIDLFRYLSNNGYRIVIITNGINEVQIKRINQSELSNTFEVIVTSEDAGYQKPHTGIFDYAFRKINVWNKERVIIVGDSLTSDIQGGINYGIDTCWFNPGRKPNKHGITPKYEIRELKEVKDILEG
ncbi:noncanonical pyrimidine nucleotidase, YjjG family protein [Paenibacillus sp. J23TS9]|uniref:YjjG family noncanonical pyrimidine nucleotidase n=1 Tax=Paenibacillus sp. J23TS9 TaxID=2807193 RepID=UPI001B1690FE|nr:noncanonical pyrimidine nucleotidase, YjjG family protein [Paenibacillus sp. J23TS9]